MAFSRGEGTLPVHRSRRRGGSSTPPRSSRRWRRSKPEPALYPADPDERRRALGARGLLRRARRARHAPGRLLGGARPAGPDVRFLDHRPRGGGSGAAAGRCSRSPGATCGAALRIRPRTHVERSKVALVGALDRIESERAGGDYLVGEGFTVADLTAAALLYPLVWPPEFQYELPDPCPEPGGPRVRRRPSGPRLDLRDLAAPPAAYPPRI